MNQCCLANTDAVAAVKQADCSNSSPLFSKGIVSIGNRATGAICAGALELSHLAEVEKIICRLHISHVLLCCFWLKCTSADADADAAGAQ